MTKRRAKDHMRSINMLAVSSLVHYYCVTGSSDGYVRVWDMRDLTQSIMKIHHPTCVRSLVFSTSASSALQIGVGLDNGSIYRFTHHALVKRWDLQKGPIRHMDRLPIAHQGPVLTLDWSNATSTMSTKERDTTPGDESTGTAGGSGGWMVSGGLDRTVKVWDTSVVHMSHKPVYTLHPPFPVRRVRWRPGYDCEVVLVSNDESGTGSGDNLGAGASSSADALSGSRVEATGQRNRDSVEIWDVRRSWIAKWIVAGSAVEGGVTDIEFCDPHTLWAQHPTGTFSQLDVRASHKPVDSVPRASVTWEAGGSLAFISGKKGRWEVPYDDIHPDKLIVQERRMISKLKGLGDPPSTSLSTSQTFGMYARDSTLRDADALAKLARRYVVEGMDRISICAHNAEVAYEVGKEQLAQAWLLAGSLLSDILPPPTPPPSPPRYPITVIPSLPHSVSAPAAIPNVHTLGKPTLEPTGRASSSEPATKKGVLTGTQGQNSASPSRTASRHATPASSQPTSPHRGHVSLPPSTPASRRPSAPLDRRASSTTTSSSSRRMSSYNSQGRPSMSSLTGEGDSPKGHHSHRHVGEGALDDSDSSGSDERHTNGGSSDEESNLRPLISPHLSTRVVPATPSPLSHVAVQQHWTEDEGTNESDESSSPSPGSTDTESGDSNAEARPQGSRSNSSLSRSRRNSRQSRSRSSTVASLPASSLLQIRKPPLVKQGSSSSIRTVLAGEGVAPVPEEAEYGSSRGHDSSTMSLRSRKRQSHGASSEYMPNTPEIQVERPLSPERVSERVQKIDEKRWLKITAQESRFRELGWTTLREALDRFADDGDVQTCAMLALIVPEELYISQRRIARFVESYVDLLTHLRLYTSAAYVRKFSPVDDVRSTTKSRRSPGVLPSLLFAQALARHGRAIHCKFD
ncbi:hypothetical protein HWV62_14940 [Athelia sp. TMB]|nr:hypothetical protein HWV62_14940 [Athelia sp. TMB]